MICSFNVDQEAERKSEDDFITKSVGSRVRSSFGQNVQNKHNAKNKMQPDRRPLNKSHLIILALARHVFETESFNFFVTSRNALYI